MRFKCFRWIILTLLAFFANIFLNFRALLCAATKQCIHPDGSEFYCKSPRTTIGSCHRFDQSVMGILNVNSEYKRSLIGMKKW